MNIIKLKKIFQWRPRKLTIIGIVVAVVLLSAIPAGVYAYNSNKYNNVINLAQKAYKSEQFDAAIKYYKEALSMNKKNTELLNKKINLVNTTKNSKIAYENGIKLLTDKKYLEAITTFKKVKDGSIYYKESIKKITECSDGYIKENLENAKLNGEKKNYTEALVFLENILTFDSSNKDALSLKQQYNIEIEKRKATGIQDTNTNTNNSSSSGSIISSPVSYTYGNTPGNIDNYGMSAFDGEYIYYSIQGKIYKVKPNGSGLSKINDASGGCISVIGEWIYFYGGMGNAGIYRMKKDGSSLTKIVGDTTMCMNVVNDWIYYFYDDSFYKVKVDGTSKTKVSYGGSQFTKAQVTNPDFAIVDDWIYTYLVNQVDKSTGLYRVKIDGSAPSQLLYSANSESHFAILNGWIYYFDLGGKEILKIKTDGTNKTSIFKTTNFSFYSINVTDNNIYFSTSNESPAQYIGLYKINMDGSNLLKITNSFCKCFCISSNWIYFDSGNSAPFKIKTDGTDQS